MNSAKGNGAITVTLIKLCYILFLRGITILFHVLRCPIYKTPLEIKASFGRAPLAAPPTNLPNGVLLQGLLHKNRRKPHKKRGETRSPRK